MRPTMESVAAERLNKLGKNPSIISTRHDLKREAAVLKDMINRVTLQPSSDDSSFDSEKEEKENLISSSFYKTNQTHLKSSFNYINDQINKSNDNLEKLDEKKFYRIFSIVPTSNLFSEPDQYKTQLRKSPSTPLSLFRKIPSTTTFFSHQPYS